MTAAPLRTIRLHGALGARFGRVFRLAVASPAEAVRALSAQLPGFRAAVEAGAWRVYRGPRKAGRDLSEQELRLGLGAAEREVHFVPAVAGAKQGGLGKVILGTLLVAASFIVPPAGVFGVAALSGSAVFGLGLSLGLAGLSQALAPTPAAARYAERDPEARSNLFGAPVNITSEGAAIPVVFGTCEVGSVVVSSAIRTERR